MGKANLSAVLEFVRLFYEMALEKNYVIGCEKIYIGRCKGAEVGSSLGSVNSPQRSTFCFWIGCGQQFRKLVCKQEVVASGSWLFFLDNVEIAAWNLIESFHTYSGK